jgi:hypothetical protein
VYSSKKFDERFLSILQPSYCFPVSLKQGKMASSKLFKRCNSRMEIARLRQIRGQEIQNHRTDRNDLQEDPTVFIIFMKLFNYYQTQIEPRSPNDRQHE